MFSEKDIKQIKEKGISLDQVNAQIKRLKDGMSYSNLVSAATIGKGVEQYDKEQIKGFIKSYQDKQDDLSIVKFVPASGAATRMFKFLFQFLQKFRPSKESIEDYSEKNSDALIILFWRRLKELPFHNDVLLKITQINPDFEDLPDADKCLQFVKTMLDENQLNYSFFPKGLLPFHKYDDIAITAFQEHLFESTLYASSKGYANLHFTVSEKHQQYFIEEFNRLKSGLETQTNTVFNVSFSYQKEATETIALTESGQLCRVQDGSVLFRPAGHGALLENLNDLNNDIIFIKNIDNIVVGDKNVEVSNYKKLLAGVLLEAQEKIFYYMHKLDASSLTKADFNALILFLRDRLNVSLNVDFEGYTAEEKIAYLKGKLNRPLRVCGMVKNQGEPGGGPFWVKDQDGEISLQVVEFAQIDFRIKNQQSLVDKATHFNPTDLVCGVKNYKGEKFNLKEFVDPEAAFITMKTQNGIDIQALELPGLWNGSMADWNSIFVEVPLETFNPVKTVNDLLKPAHQSS